MKPNCMNCNNIHKLICPLLQPFMDVRSKDPEFWDILLEMVKDSAVVCDLYKQKEYEKGGDE